MKSVGLLSSFITGYWAGTKGVKMGSWQRDSHLAGLSDGIICVDTLADLHTR